MSVIEVWWEADPSRSRYVTSFCSRCFGDSIDRFDIVSPTGTAHLSAEDGRTACGIDATGDEWWWKT